VEEKAVGVVEEYLVSAAEMRVDEIAAAHRVNVVAEGANDVVAGDHASLEAARGGGGGDHQPRAPWSDAPLNCEGSTHFADSEALKPNLKVD
jgi:hypothetical protein